MRLKIGRLLTFGLLSIFSSVSMMSSVALARESNFEIPHPQKFNFDVWGRPSDDATLAKIQSIIRQVMYLKYPGLKSYKVMLKDFHDKDSFLEAQPSKDEVIASPMGRKYYVKINPLLLKNYPGDEAIAAIVTHELSHIHDYIRMSFPDIVHLGLVLYQNKNFVIPYERATDQIALMKGAGPGLILYRQWLYTMIKDIPGAMDMKLKAYFTPEQIEDFMSEHADEIESFDSPSYIQYSGFNTATARQEKKYFNGISFTSIISTAD